MRLLILSCNTGEGHNSCAKAVCEYTLQQGDSCEIADSLSFISEPLSRFISGGHSWMYRNVPAVFAYGYRHAERHEVAWFDSSLLYGMFSAGTERLYAFLREGHYDAVLCAHVFAAHQMQHLLRKHPMQIDTFFLATDYTCSPGCGTSGLGRYFIPDDTLADDFIDRGIPAYKLIAAGIPVRQCFYERSGKAEAKRHWGISPEQKHLLVMCGSMGCGPMRETVDVLAKRMGEEIVVSVVYGRNETLRRKMEKAFSDHSRIHIHGYVTEMTSLMDSADLYLTKPGGISVSEAATKGLPMVFINAVEGCETYNLQFFESLGGAVSGKTPWQLSELCLRILADEEERKRMRDALQPFAKRNAAKTIYERIAGNHAEVRADETTTCGQKS